MPTGNCSCPCCSGPSEPANPAPVSSLREDSAPKSKSRGVRRLVTDAPTLWGPPPPPAPPPSAGRRGGLVAEFYTAASTSIAATALGCGDDAKGGSSSSSSGGGGGLQRAARAFRCAGELCDAVNAARATDMAVRFVKPEASAGGVGGGGGGGSSAWGIALSVSAPKARMKAQVTLDITSLCAALSAAGMASAAAAGGSGGGPTLPASALAWKASVLWVMGTENKSAQLARAAAVAVLTACAQRGATPASVLKEVTAELLACQKTW